MCALQDWQQKRAAAGERAAYVWNQQQFDALDTGTLDYVMGEMGWLHLRTGLREINLCENESKFNIIFICQCQTL